jgi:predicted secreted protein
MAGGAASRDLIIKKNDVALAGVNSKSVAVASEPIDVTTDEDAGYRCLLDAAGTETIDISGSGVTKDVLLRSTSMTAGTKMLTDITVEFPIVGSQTTTGDEISGNFYLTSYTDNGGGSDGAIEFDFALQSSGPWVYTAGS